MHQFNAFDVKIASFFNIFFMFICQFSRYFFADLPAGDQYFGQAFMELKDNFYSAYAYHFRCVEQISAIVENVRKMLFGKHFFKINFLYKSYYVFFYLMGLE